VIVSTRRAASTTSTVLPIILLASLEVGCWRAASGMQADVDRLARAAEGLEGAWPSQPPPAVPEAAIVARHGKAAAPLLVALLSDDPNAERDRGRWKVQQQVSLALAGILDDEDVGYKVPWSLAQIGDRRAIGPLIAFPGPG
jgi:hypothetical protein